MNLIELLILILTLFIFLTSILSATALTGLFFTFKFFIFISENRGSKLVLVSTYERSILEFSYRTKRGDKKSKKENLVVFVDIKGRKAMGNKLGNYLRMSGFKLLERNEEKSEILEAKDNTELTLFN